MYIAAYVSPSTSQFWVRRRRNSSVCRGRSNAVAMRAPRGDWGVGVAPLGARSGRSGGARDPALVPPPPPPVKAWPTGGPRSRTGGAGLEAHAELAADEVVGLLAAQGVGALPLALVDGLEDDAALRPEAEPGLEPVDVPVPGHGDAARVG